MIFFLYLNSESESNKIIIIFFLPRWAHKIPKYKRLNDFQKCFAHNSAVAKLVYSYPAR